MCFNYEDTAAHLFAPPSATYGELHSIRSAGSADNPMPGVKCECFQKEASNFHVGAGVSEGGHWNEKGGEGESGREIND